MTDYIGQRFGNYRLIRFLGEGGFATVYLGAHIHLNTLAAIKILSTKFTMQEIEQFRHEAYLLAHLNHSNIVRVLDFGLEETEVLPFLVMQYASHGTLRQQHIKGESVPLPTVLSYIKPIAAALQYAHDNQIIHRDVKPENMLISDQKEILLSDFGIALNTQNAQLQKTLEINGTASYMAPEQCKGHAQPASDQYALGIVAYEWLSGSYPFYGSFTEVCSQHIMAPPQPLQQRVTTISPKIAAVVGKALEKNPEQRFSSIQEFAAAFVEAAEGNATWKARIIIPANTSMEYKWYREEESVEPQSILVPTSTYISTSTRQDARELEQRLPTTTNSPKKRKNLLAAILVLTLILILTSSGTLAAFTISNNTRMHGIVTASASATAAAPFISGVDFTTQTPTILNMTLMDNQTVFSTDHAILSAGQQVTISFMRHPKKMNVALSIRALVSQNGPNNPGFSPITIYCNGQTVVSNYTIPGNGNSPDTTSIQLPDQQLTSTKNTLQIQVATNAITVFWLYHLGITQSN